MVRNKDKAYRVDTDPDSPVARTLQREKKLVYSLGCREKN